MKQALMAILACPVCKGNLTLKIAKKDGDEIVQGSLHCKNCNDTYTIEDTIPNLLPSSLRP